MHFTPFSVEWLLLPGWEALGGDCGGRGGSLIRSGYDEQEGSHTRVCSSSALNAEM